MPSARRSNTSADQITSSIDDWGAMFDALSPDLKLRGRGVQRYGHCPFHDDKSPSFSLNAQTGLWKCFAGCGQGDAFAFVSKLFDVSFPEAVNRLGELAGVSPPSGGRSAKLSLQQFASSKWLSVEHLRENGWETAGAGLRVVYRDESGAPAPRVRRRYAITAKDGSAWEGPRDAAVIPYGLWRLDEARKARHLILVEGETDALTLWHHGFPALGLPGSRMAHLLDRKHLNGIESLYIVREPDEGGRHFVEGIHMRLRSIGWSGSSLEIAMEDGDVNDLHRMGGPDTFRSSFLRLMNDAIEIGEATTRPGLHRAEPFPVHALPEPLCTYVTGVARAMVCPPDFVAVPLLVSCAAAIGNTCELEVKRGWYEQARFFSAIVAEPGSRKTPALAFATKPVLDEQVRMRNEYQVEYAKYEDELAAYEEARKKRDNEGVPSPPPKAPRLKQLYVSDSTIEALAEVLRENPRGVLVVRDELSGWVRDQGRYQQGRSGERKQWLSLWSGAPLVINRRSFASATIVESPFVNVVGNILPDALHELVGDAGYSDGFAERLLFAFPDPVPVRWNDDEVEERAQRAIDQHFGKLWALKSEDGERARQTFQLSPSAREVFRSILSEHYEEMNGGQISDMLRGAWSKLEAYFARITLLIHVCRLVEHDASLDVDNESVLRAAVVWEYFKAHARRVLEYIHGSDLDKALERALRWIRRQRREEIPLRDFISAKVGGATTMEDVHHLLDELMQRGVGYTDKRKGGERGPGKLVFCVADAATQDAPHSASSAS